MSAKTSDETWMALALGLARDRLGRTAPNPSVGCVIVRGGAIVGKGATGDGGRPHAEEIALAQAGDGAEGATAYVSLEPCNARSSGALSCSQRLAGSGVLRVVIACEDPNPSAAHGVSRLGAAGVETTLGVLREQAEALNCGFFKRLRTGRPWLAIDSDPASYDAAFDAAADETIETALVRMGRAGMTRLVIAPQSRLAAIARASGLLDDDRA